MENKAEKKLGLILLIALGVGSMIGGGIFNSPTDLIGKANPEAAIIAWLIGGAGVIFLALVFQMLSNLKPDLTGGIFTYAQEGFGDFMGFNSAWGYWLSAWIGNVAFIILIFKTVNSLIPLSPIATFIIASALLWVLHFVQTKGVKSVGTINAIATVAKIIPLILVIILGLTLFSKGNFFVANWKSMLASANSSTDLFTQIKSAMGTILWCFIGVEAATVLSEKARSPKDVGTATVLSLIITLILYMLVSISSMGAVDAKTLASANTPLATVLSMTSIGAVGGIIVKLGLIISLVGCLISWIMLAAEIPYIAAKGGTMPSWFKKENSTGCPVNSLLLTDILTQLFLFSILLPVLQTAYNNVSLIATTAILIPYLFSAMFALKVSIQEKGGIKNIIIAGLACLYSIYVIYAVGLKFLGCAAILYAIGILFYMNAKKEKGESITGKEKLCMIFLAAFALLIIILLATGKLSLA